MSPINGDLLALDPRQAVISPTVMAEVRHGRLDYGTYLRLLAQDAALGRSPMEWGDLLAEDGLLAIAKLCWTVAGLSESRILEKFQLARYTWETKTAQRIGEIERPLQENQARIGRSSREKIETLLQEAEKYAERDWYDCVQKTLNQAHQQLDQALAAALEDRERERFRLLQEIDALYDRLTYLDPFPSGSEGEKAVSRLLLGARHMLNESSWSSRQVRAMISLAVSLCDGGEPDEVAVANVLGEGSKTSQVAVAPKQPQSKEAIIEAFQEATQVELPDAQQLQRQENSETIHRKANYLRYNKQFAPAERLYRQALQLWPGNEPAAKNYASMLQQIGRVEDSIAVLEQGLAHAHERLPFFNMLMNFSIVANEFGKARNYAQKALRLAGDPLAEIGVLSSLVTLEVKANNIPQAIEYCDAILRLNPRHEHFRSEKERLTRILTGQVVAPTEAEDQPVTDFIIEPVIEVSPLLAEDLETCELTKVNPAILTASDPTKVLEEANRLTDMGVSWNPQQPKERADYFLQAAKIVLQSFGPSEVKDSIAKILQKYLNNYTGAMGDYFLTRRQMDSARAYYLEHIRLFDQWLPWYTLYTIANYFQTFVTRDEDMVGLAKRLKGHQIVIAVLGRALEATPEGERLEIGRGIVEIARVNRTVHKVILQELRAKPGFGRNLVELLRGVATEYGIQSTTESAADLLIQIVQHRRVSIERQEDRLRRIIEAVSDRRRLPEVDMHLQTLTSFQAEWNATDQSLFLRVRELGRETQRYFEESRFEDKEFLQNSVVMSAERFLKELDDSPTYLGRAYFSRIVYRFRRLVEEEHRKLRMVSLPELVPTIVKTAWLVVGKKRECHIEIANEGESAAQDVTVRILESETGDYVHDPTPFTVPGNSIYARPHSVTVAIPVSLHDEAASKDAVDLRVKLEYYDRENQEKETAPTRLRLSLRDEEPFLPIDNPYRTGLPVRDRGMFVGRSAFVDELTREVCRRERTSAVVIYGQKRSGKTSILHHVGMNTPDWVLPVYFSMQTVLLEDDMVPGMFYLIADEIANQCRLKGRQDQVGNLSWEQLQSPPGPSLQFRMYLERIRQLPDVRLVLLVDEFTELSAKIDEGKIDRSIMKYLKSLIEQGFFSCILSGIDNMPQVLKRYSNELAVSDPRFVGYLKHDSAAELIERPILLPNERSRFISPQVVDEIIRLTAGSPYYIQFVCHRLVEYLNRTKNPTVTGADVDRVVAELIQGQTRLDPFTKFDNLFRYKEDEARDTRETTVEGLFLYLLADETRTRPYAPFSAVRQRASFVNEDELLVIATQLEERQVIERSTGPIRQYRIIVDLFRQWINANRPMDNDATNAFRRNLERTAT